jgi:hypothetical protein
MLFAKPFSAVMERVLGMAANPNVESRKSNVESRMSKVEKSNVEVEC